MRGGTLLERIMDKVEMLPWTGCWIFCGARDQWGYGNVKDRDAPSGVSKVHRAVYTELIGPIPPGKQLDHRCRVTACCNPAHLEPVSNWRNQQRKKHARRKAKMGKLIQLDDHRPLTTGLVFCVNCEHQWQGVWFTSMHQKLLVEQRTVGIECPRCHELLGALMRSQQL